MSKRLPSLKASEVIRALKRAGFYEKRQAGSHVILRKEGLPRPVPVPMHAKDLPRALLADIIKETGLSQDEFLELL